MYHKAQLLALSGLAFINSSTATPFTPHNITVNCNNVTTGLDPSCWVKLNMTGWMNHWSINTPGANGDASIEVPSETAENPSEAFGNPFASGAQLTDTGFNRRAVSGCEEGELWSTCFLRLGLGKPGQDCSHVGHNDCDAPKAGKAPKTAQIFYGVWNIYAVNAYFYAIENAIQILIHDPTKQDVFSNAATTGPGSIPYDLSPGKSYSVDSVLIQLLLKQTDNRSYPWSPNKPLVEYLQKYMSKHVYDRTTGIDVISNDMLYTLDDALAAVMTDLPTFVKFVDNGAFSTTNLTTAEELVTAFEAK